MLGAVRCVRILEEETGQGALPAVLHCFGRVRAAARRRTSRSPVLKISCPSPLLDITTTAPPYLRLAMLLAINTGQRQGDLLRLPWSAYNGREIRLRQANIWLIEFERVVFGHRVGVTTNFSSGSVSSVETIVRRKSWPIGGR